MGANTFAQVAVIANKSVSENAITTGKVGEIYTLKAKTWSDGKAIVPVTLKSDNAETQKFFGAFGKSFLEIKKLWMKLQLTGEGQPPEGFGSEEDIINKVASTAGAIGFVGADKVNNKVKVLLTIN
jgi:ABC-type phosphate transport system substrate-binding protein